MSSQCDITLAAAVTEAQAPRVPPQTAALPQQAGACLASCVKPGQFNQLLDDSDTGVLILENMPELRFYDIRTNYGGFGGLAAP